MLSVIVIAKNEESRIESCLESVKWADEIILVDNGSTDKTIEIAKKYTDKIIKFENLDYAAFRNKGFEKAAGDWVLYVDPDERVLAPLRAEIEQLINQNEYCAFAISRRNIIFGHEVKYGPFWPDWAIRLLRKKEFAGWVGEIHEYPKFKGKLGYTKSSLLHLTHRNVDQVVLKSLAWSKIDANLRIKANHPKMSSLRFLRILFGEIFNQGILRKGFFNGSVGVIDSMMQAFSLFITYVRLWQLQQDPPLDETYDEIDKKIVGNGFNF